MRTRIIRALFAATAAGIALTTLGLAGATAPATAATQSLSPPVYQSIRAGYQASGRWFRFVTTTVTIAPAAVPATDGGSMNVLLQNGNGPYAAIFAEPGGGADSLGWSVGQGLQRFGISPQVGDQVALSIYYDQHGHTSFTAADLTQGTSGTGQATVGSMLYNQALLVINLYSRVPAPAADTRLWKVAGTHLTTYSAARGTLTGPWHTSQVIQTSTGTTAGTVIASPSGLWNNGANFGVWLRALPVTYTSGFAGYTDSGGPFRFAATTLTVPPAQTPGGNGGAVLVSLGHNGGPTPRPYASITVAPGGGAGSISYASNAAHGTFTVSPSPGDQLRVSVYYDQNGHYSLAVTDTTTGDTQTVTVAAPYVSSIPLNSAQVLAMFDNSTMTPPPADTPIWQFTASNVTTYTGYHGSVFGPWATSRWIDTTDGTHTGAVVADATVLANAGQDFGVWLRHH
jgi:hypothetical protein